MTAALVGELATALRALLESARAEAQLLVRVAQALRATTPELDREADELDALARRCTERVRLLERYEDRGLLEDTQVLTVADLADDE